MLAIACEPGPRCHVTPRQSGPGLAPVLKAWCPDDRIRVTVEGCPASVARAAAAVWVGILDPELVTEGSGGDIHITRGDYPGTPIGHTAYYFTGNAMDYAEIVVEECDAPLIAHELGHALGFGHASDENQLMFKKLVGRLVDEQEIAAYDAARRGQ